jgi:hypothetical protein
MHRHCVRDIDGRGANSPLVRACIRRVRVPRQQSETLIVVDPVHLRSVFGCKGLSEDMSHHSGRECVKLLGSSYTGLYSQRLVEW